MLRSNNRPDCVGLGVVRETSLGGDFYQEELGWGNRGREITSSGSCLPTGWGRGLRGKKTRKGRADQNESSQGLALG